MKPAPFCTLFAGLGSTDKFAASLLLSDSRSVLAALCSFPSFLLPQSLSQEQSSLSSCSIRLQWVPGHSFPPGNDAADELARRRVLIVPSVIPCILTLISRVDFFLFTDWKRTFSSQFFDTQVPSVFTEELVPPRHARCMLSRLRCNGHSLLLSSFVGLAESRMLYAAPAEPAQDTVHLILHCPDMDFLRGLIFGDSLSLPPLVQALESCRASGAPWSIAMPPSLGRGPSEQKPQLSEY